MAEGSNQARDLLLPSMPWRLAWGSAVAEGSIHARTLSGGSAGAEGSIHARALSGAGGLLVVSWAEAPGCSQLRVSCDSAPDATRDAKDVAPGFNHDRDIALHTGLPLDSAPDATCDAK